MWTSFQHLLFIIHDKYFNLFSVHITLQYTVRQY